MKPSRIHADHASANGHGTEPHVEQHVAREVRGWERYVRSLSSTRPETVRERWAWRGLWLLCVVALIVAVLAVGCELRHGQRVHEASHIHQGVPR